MEWNSQKLNWTHCDKSQTFCLNWRRANCWQLLMEQLFLARLSHELLPFAILLSCRWEMKLRANLRAAPRISYSPLLRGKSPITRHSCSIRKLRGMTVFAFRNWWKSYVLAELSGRLTVKIVLQLFGVNICTLESPSRDKRVQVLRE